MNRFVFNLMIDRMEQMSTSHSESESLMHGITKEGGGGGLEVATTVKMA
jgi:hypothetical protein